MKTKNTFRTLTLLAGMLAMIGFAIGSGDDPINFSHPLHVDINGMACDECHMSIMETMTGDMIEMPGHDVCEMCHEVEDDCDMCHNGEPDASPAIFVGERYTMFAHGIHVGQQCENCHSLTDQDNPTFPTDVTCQTCHAEHEVKPRTHDLATWHSDHGYDAMISEADCAVCHTQDTCDECHQGENILANTPHPPEWEFTHSLETMYGQECLTCHETRDECITCHRSKVPTPHELGPAFANEQTGGTHKDEAEGFILACLACHDVENEDPTCARCHE